MKKNIIFFIAMSICAHSGLLAAPTWRKGYPYNKEEMAAKLKATNFDTFLRLTDYSLSAYAIYRTACFVSHMATTFYAPEYKSLRTLSTDQIIFAPLTPNSQHKFMQWKTDYFVALLNKKLDFYSEEEQKNVRKDIVTQYNFYQFSGFVSAISAWPEFEEHIIALNTRFEQNPEAYEPFKHLQGFGKDKFYDFIKAYYSKISNQS